MEKDEKLKHPQTTCFTYEVTMVVQVLARDRDEADVKLDSEGGFVSKRDIVFKDMVSIYSGEQD